MMNEASLELESNLGPSCGCAVTWQYVYDIIRSQNLLVKYPI